MHKPTKKGIIELTEEEKTISFIPYTDDLKEFFRFHPTVTPRGLQFYDKLILNARQQNELNIFKANIARENHIYMEDHPEIRAMISIFLKHLLRKSQYQLDVRSEAAKFFSRPRNDIENEIERYLYKRNENYTKEYDKHENPSSESVELPSTISLKDYTFETFTDIYTRSSSCSIEYEMDEEKDWHIPGLFDFLVGKPIAEEEEAEEEQVPSIYIPPRGDYVSTYSGITKTSSFIEPTIPSVPDVTSITDDTELSGSGRTTPREFHKKGLPTEGPKVEGALYTTPSGTKKSIKSIVLAENIEKSGHALKLPTSLTVLSTSSRSGSPTSPTRITSRHVEGLKSPIKLEHYRQIDDSKDALSVTTSSPIVITSPAASGTAVTKSVSPSKFGTPGLVQSPTSASQKKTVVIAENIVDSSDSLHDRALNVVSGPSKTGSARSRRALSRGSSKASGDSKASSTKTLVVIEKQETPAASNIELKVINPLDTAIATVEDETKKLDKIIQNKK